MGRLNKKPIVLLPGVTIKREGDMITVQGQKGERKVPVLPFMDVAISGDSVMVQSKDESRQAKINQGTMWSLIKGAVQGAAQGFSKILEISGIGYKAAMEGKTLVLSLGYAHPVRFEPPAGVSIVVEKNVITISGVNKEMVGRTAAEIRALKKPEPYKGKGIRYQTETVRRKSGKKAATAGAVGGGA